MSQSSINGRAAPLDAAIAEAAGLIGKSRLTVVAGLGADVAGARAAIALCERIGGVVDHMSSTALLRDLDVLRESGMMLTTPGEARTRGDVVLLVGNGLVESGLLEAMPDLRTRALTPPAAEGALRRIFRLGGDEADMRALAGTAADSVSKIETISADEASLPDCSPPCAPASTAGPSRFRALAPARSTRSPPRCDRRNSAWLSGRRRASTS